MRDLTGARRSAPPADRGAWGGGSSVELALPEPGSGETYPIVFVGLQGAGKTATVGKVARWLTGRGYTVVAAAADTVRPAASEQLKVAATKVGFDVVDHTDTGVATATDADPIAIVTAAQAKAQADGADILLVDTAGRLHLDSQLQTQARDIREAAGSAGSSLFVLDAMGGQEVVNVAAGFRDAVGFDGVVLTKTDGDLRGGAALSVKNVTGVPIVFVGTGEGVDDLELFHPDRAANRVLDRGDLTSLAEKALGRVGSSEAARLARGEIDFDTFLSQLKRLRGEGDMLATLRLLPGARKHLGSLEGVDDHAFAEMEALIEAMTPEERANPKLLRGNQSRRVEVAASADAEPDAVGRLFTRLDDVKASVRKVVAQSNGKQVDGITPDARRAATRVELDPAEKARRRAKNKSSRRARRR